MLKDSLALGPAWTHGTTEKPQGLKNMGSWVAAVHTPEQMARMNLKDSLLKGESKSTWAPKSKPAMLGASKDTWSPNMADNALTCDSAGNCMLTDELKEECFDCV